MKKFSLKRLFAWCAITGGVVLGVDKIQTEDDSLTYDFNFNAAAELYDLSCEERERSRTEEVREPFSWLTPHDFEKKSDQVVLLSSRLSEEERRKANEIVENIPRHIYDLIYSQGGVLVFTKESLLEALPEQTRPIRGLNKYAVGYVGLYKYQHRRMFVTFNLHDYNEDTKEWGFRSYLSDSPDTTRHEIGHFLDHMLGTLGINRTDPATQGSTYRQVSYSQSEAFKEAYYADLDQLIKKPPPILSFYSHYLPDSYKGVDLYGGQETLGRARQESFAELWSQVGDKSTRTLLYSYFPRTTDLLEDLNRQLMTAYQKADMACTYRYEQKAPDREQDNKPEKDGGVKVAGARSYGFVR